MVDTSQASTPDRTASIHRIIKPKRRPTPEAYKGSVSSSGTRVGATEGRSSNLNFWFKPNLEFGEILDRRFRSQQALQILQQVLLARLTERKPIDC